MVMPYTIEKGIPIPVAKDPPKKWEKYFPFLPYMKIGDSFFIPDSDGNVYKSVPYSAAKKMNIILKRYRVDEEGRGKGHRVFRVMPNT